MRLQGAVFDFSGTLLDQADTPLPGLERFLSLMKMEGVWMYVVADRDRRAVERTLEKSGLSGFFRGVMSADEHGGDVTDPELWEKAVRRLRTARRATAVFTSRASVLRALKAAGFQVVLVGPAEDQALAALADEVVQRYDDMTRLGPLA